MTSLQHAQAQLASTISRTIQRHVQGRRSYVEALAEQTVKDGLVAGFVELDGSGEALVQIDFPLRFIETPVFGGGLELRDNAWLTWGAFPTWSATVADWKTEQLADTTLYTGATIGVVTFNADHANLHYTFQGRTLANPAGPDTSVGQTL